MDMQACPLGSLIAVIKAYGLMMNHTLFVL